MALRVQSPRLRVTAFLVSQSPSPGTAPLARRVARGRRVVRRQRRRKRRRKRRRQRRRKRRWQRRRRWRRKRRRGGNGSGGVVGVGWRVGWRGGASAAASEAASAAALAAASAAASGLASEALSAAASWHRLLVHPFQMSCTDCCACAAISHHHIAPLGCVFMLETGHRVCMPLSCHTNQPPHPHPPMRALDRCSPAIYFGRPDLAKSVKCKSN